MTEHVVILALLALCLLAFVALAGTGGELCRRGVEEARRVGDSRRIYAEAPTVRDRMLKLHARRVIVSGLLAWLCFTVALAVLVFAYGVAGAW